MEIASTWAQAISQVQPWVPLHRHSVWSRHKVVYWQCAWTRADQSSGHIVDPQLPSLGQNSFSRTWRTTNDRISFHHPTGTTLQEGNIYVVYGGLAPVWHESDACWMAELPKMGPVSGCCKLVGHDAQGCEVMKLPEALTPQSALGCLAVCCPTQDMRGLQAMNVKPADVSLSGYVAPESGRFRPLPTPRSGQTWTQWLQENRVTFQPDTWATIDGHHVKKEHRLSGDPIILRLHLRLRGGAKPTMKHDSIMKKLITHLQEKGVPAETAPERAELILDTLGAQTVSEAYEAIDPWKALKQAAGNRVRLVQPGELKSAKSRSKATGAEDPWLQDDPWKSAKVTPERQAPKEEKNPAPIAISLVPGHFLDEDGAPLPILDHIASEAKGVAMMDVEDFEAFKGFDYLLSEDELGAVILGTQQPNAGGYSSKAITFPAWNTDSKVLLRGYLVDLGSRKVQQAQAKHCINIQIADVAILSVEIRKEYTAVWQSVARNPLKHAWMSIEGLQRATITTWSRRFFGGRKETKAEFATSWHAFVKIQASNLEHFLQQSGRAAVFLTPKEVESAAPSGKFRVIWLDHSDLERAQKTHRLHPEFLGIVRGKQSLGLRTRAAEYTALRKKLDPSWGPDGILVDVVVARRWILAPMPPQVDKSLVQQIISKLGWRAVPLKQIAANSWLIGSEEADTPPSDTFEFAGKPVLITEQTARKPKSESDVVVAAPTAFKRNFQERLAKKLPVQGNFLQTTSDVAMAPNTIKATTSSMLAEIKEELNGRLLDLQTQMQHAVNSVNQRVEAVESQAATVNMELQASVLHNEQRVQQMESMVQSMQTTVVTKADLTEALRSAMESQTRDIRMLLNPKRSPDASPAGEAKVSRIA